MSVEGLVSVTNHPLPSVEGLARGPHAVDHPAACVQPTPHHSARGGVPLLRAPRTRVVPNKHSIRWTLQLGSECQCVIL